MRENFSPSTFLFCSINRRHSCAFTPPGRVSLVLSRGAKKKQFALEKAKDKYHFSPPYQDILTENCNARCCRQQIPIIIKAESQKHPLTNTMCCEREKTIPLLYCHHHKEILSFGIKLFISVSVFARKFLHQKVHLPSLCCSKVPAFY